MTLTPSENKLRILMKIWMITFSIATLAFLVLGDYMLQTINGASLALFPALPLINIPQERFWLTLTISLMITLVYLCYQCQSKIRQNRALVPAVLLSKFISTFFFFLFFVFHQRALAYFAGVIVDGSIFVVTYYLYWKSTQELAINNQS